MLNDSVYIYDSDLIRKNCREILGIPYVEKSVHFATMSNCSHEFLKIIENEGLGVFVNSLSHLDAAKKAGFRKKQIVFTAAALDRKVMKRLHQENIIVNLDSVNQIALWQGMFPLAPAGIRVNTSTKVVRAKKTRAGYFLGNKSRLGITRDEIKKIHNKEKINGLHIYVGTDILDVEYFISFYKELSEIASEFTELEYLDLGGGFGIDDTLKTRFDFKEYGKRVTGLMEDISSRMGRTIRLILEPGRIIGGEAGYFICRVTDIKKRGELQIVGVNASSVQFPRPLFYPQEALHPAWLLDSKGKLKNGSLKNSSVVGCSTYSRDYLAHKIQLPVAEIDDILIFGHSGAYSSSAYTEFLGFPKPKEIFI